MDKMRLLWILLPILLQGVNVEAQFSVQPQSQVVRTGQAVELECITRSPINICSWKLEVPELDASGFLTTAIPPNLDITARDKSSKTDCSIIINNVGSRYDGNYTCSPYMNTGAQEDSAPASVTIAVKPARIELVGDAAGQITLMASAEEPTAVACQASGARPAATLAWYIGMEQQYDGVVENVEDPQTRLITSKSTLTYQFKKMNNGQQLKCVATHPGYSEDDTAVNREASITVEVQYAPYRPDGNQIDKIYGFIEGQEGVVTVNFTANPRPNEVAWRVGSDVVVNQGSASLDNRFSSGFVETLDEEHGSYMMVLTINPVHLEDQDTNFALELGNGVGEKSSLEFTIGIGAAPPPPGSSELGAAPSQAGDTAPRDMSAGTTNALGSAAIIGIIVAAVVLLLLIGLFAFGRSRGKWCFAAPEGGRGPEAGAPADTEAAEKAAQDNSTHEQKPAAAPETETAAAGDEHKNGSNGAPPPSDTPV